MSQPEEVVVTSEQVRFAWHDAVCPEGDDCRDRRSHALYHTLMDVVLDKFLTNLGVTIRA